MSSIAWRASKATCASIASWSDADDPLGPQELDLAPSLSPIEEPKRRQPPASRWTTSPAPIEAAASPARPSILICLPTTRLSRARPGRTRRTMTPVERLAALDSAVPARPPIIPDPPGGKADFIAAARRAAQAASSSSNDKSSVKHQRRCSEQFKETCLNGCVPCLSRPPSSRSSSAASVSCRKCSTTAVRRRRRRRRRRVS